ncbi:esterase FE4-like [Trichoplusia ni]|uniref:Esterase FE4-like n=1 Tax=Trichoplusia ni TaxID=7111 RepID=A0A7E5VJH0_TRINI|nr:esterase FE4-like [Trichoplusia ni]
MVMFIILLSLFSAVYAQDAVTVVTGKGPIQGYKKDGFNTFFGVPFALVNEENPFGSTLPYPNFKTPFNANDSSIICPQVYFNDNGVIQCLRLNIYVPTSSAKKPLPIFVWFHGGGFAFGSAGEYGGQYLVKHDIIVITVNYRQGPYGFLCLNDPSVPGNQGMKDQIVALRWIKENIGAFGGDPNKVTIAGESYGGGAVDLHLYSKYETLFQKAIVQSGSLYVSEGIFVKADYEAAIKLAKQLGHNAGNTRDALKYLARANPVDVSAATRNLSMILTFCKEKKFKGVQNFITDDPYHLPNNDRVKNTPIMIGYTSQEMLYEFVNKPKEFYDKLTIGFQDQLKKTFVLKKKELDMLSGIVRSFYLGGKAIGPESQLELSDFVSDFALNYGAEWSVNRYMEQGAKVYKYMFSYIGASEYKNVTGAGASHTEELKYLFDWVWAAPLVGAEQQMMRDRMTTLWANFVKHGNPTPQKTDLLPVTWSPVTGIGRQYLNIDVEMSMRDHAFQQRIAFWDLFWHVYLKKHVLLN